MWQAAPMQSWLGFPALLELRCQDARRAAHVPASLLSQKAVHESQHTVAHLGLQATNCLQLALCERFSQVEPHIADQAGGVWSAW